MYALIQLPAIITVKPVSGLPPDAKASGGNFFEIFIPRGGLWNKNAYVKV